MHHLEKAKIAITIKYIDELAKQGVPGQFDDILKNLMAAAAEPLLAVARSFDDKQGDATQSLVYTFLKMVGLQHIQFVADHGVLPAVDGGSKAMLYNGLLQVLKNQLQKELAAEK